MQGQTDTWGDFLSQIDAERTYSEALTMSRRMKRLYSDTDYLSRRAALTRSRIALTGNYTLSFFQTPLEAYLGPHGILADFFAGEFNNYQQELLAEDSALYAFAPEVVVLFLDHHAVHHWPKMGASPADVNSAADRQTHEWEVLWEKVRSRCGASVIQTNIALPCERALGHFEAKTEWSATHYLRRLNQRLAERAPSYVSICDAEHLSGLVGKRIWFDEPVLYNTKQGLGFGAVPALAHSLAALIAALLGKSRKCLVLDLDNTLWGGVVGDVGVENLRLASGDPVGEAFLGFQRYCRQLKERGVLLAVCSKNDSTIARAPFQTHPEMVLKLDDFSAFTANWDDKVSNLRRIGSQLNLGLDSFVFVDDNPAERALVRRYLPEVAVPEMPEDPALFRRVLDGHRYFEVAALSREDQKRTDYYLAAQKREAAALATSDFNEFLDSLGQKCTSGPFDEMNLQRIVQLINKTNQWNLTTLRLTEGKVRELMADPAYYTRWVRHQDRFGDNGLIALIIAREQQAALEIEEWLMSCRVIQRGIEDFVFNELLDEARRRGVTSIHGHYRPTPKNGMVSSFYEDLGFERTAREEDGTSRWRLDLSHDVCRRPHYINRQEAHSRESRS